MLSGCNAGEGEDTNTNIKDFEGLVVRYVDVGQGDSILIKFPDQKSLMIDCGGALDSVTDNIQKSFDDLGVENLDYLVLTHPDLDHVGSALNVLQTISVDSVFIPNVLEPQKFSTFNSALNYINANQIESIIFDNFCYIVGQDYSLAFLSPLPMSDKDSPYIDFNFALEPNETQINDISAVIYLEYKGVRFLFTGDAGEKIEEKILLDYYSGVFKQNFSKHGINVNLAEIDFLKLAHHGSKDSSTEDFLNLVKPKNAIISVGGNNFYGHPSTQTLSRLYQANQTCAVWRTDVKGDITVKVDKNGLATIQTLI